MSVFVIVYKFFNFTVSLNLAIYGTFVHRLQMTVINPTIKGIPKSSLIENKNRQ
jgi:hypothetical protein